MPLYRCLVAPRLTSYDQRAAIAEAVTRIHCEVTGGLPLFVHAFFVEDETGMLPADTRAVVLGSIRTGRTAAQKERLVAELAESVARIVDVPRDEVSVVTVDVPARWVMEGGDILPEPGDEAAWMAKHSS
jgi:phenylpyruvate tautomerase PptA (4-oxalocrotonate tautomerase family)